MAGHKFVVGSRVHFKTSGGALPPEIVADTVYYVDSVVAGVSFTVTTAAGSGPVTPSTNGTAPNMAGKIVNAIIGNPFVQAPGVVITQEAGTVILQP